VQGGQGNDFLISRSIGWNELFIGVLTIPHYIHPQMTFYRVEKYRPVTLDDLVSHEDITSTSKPTLLT